MHLMKLALLFLVTVFIQKVDSSEPDEFDYSGYDGFDGYDGFSGSGFFPWTSETNPIVQGIEAEFREFPSQVFIELDNGNNQCGGSLVFDEWVLTAAHCFDRNQKATRISLGSNSRYAPDGQNFTAMRTCCHEDYNFITLEHDICMVKLSSKPVEPGYAFLTFESLFLDRNETYPENNTMCDVAGWGYDEFNNLPDRLLRANVFTIDKETCAKPYKNLGNNLPKSTICAGHLEGGSDTCGGDSGGPLLCYRNGVKTLHGITSQGYSECGAKGFPGVYTKVADYIPWIKKTRDNPCSSHSWGPWKNICSVTCGNGKETGTRDCLNEKGIKADDKNCEGTSRRRINCSRPKCSVNPPSLPRNLQLSSTEYHWGKWVKICGVTCGEGIEINVRPCLDDNNLAVLDESCDGEARSSGKCNPGPCNAIAEYHWGEWIKTCSVTCGEGIEVNSRDCFDAKNLPTSEENCDGGSQSIGKCNPGKCGAYHWGQWIKTCGVTCGEGIEVKFRSCLDEENMEADEENCDGDPTSIGECKLGKCTETEQICFLVQATAISQMEFDNKLKILESDLQFNLKAITGYLSVELTSTFDGSKGTVNLIVNVDSTPEASRLKNLINIYVQSFAGRRAFESAIKNCGDNDPCPVEPCQNGGVCAVKENSVQCQCEQEYVGLSCETDPCLRNPCLNKGVCTFLLQTSYQCQCFEGYVGNNCERRITINPCSRKPCKNEGICTRVSSSDYQCQCTPDYSGKNCETKTILDPCKKRPCQNRGICTSLSKTAYQCRCFSGYSGDNCETEVILDPCEKQPCQNRGICVPLSTSAYQCQCTSGYSGDNCEIEVILDPCERQPCQNRGICVPLSTSAYRCQCTSGYSGDNCETEITVDPCVRNPCRNGGICTGFSSSSYECQCTSAYSGKNCQIRVTKSVEEFCFRLVSRNGLTPRLFTKLYNSFRNELTRSMRSVAEFRGISFEAKSVASPNGGAQLSVKVRIKAATGNRNSAKNVEEDLLRHAKASSIKVGIGRLPVACQKSNIIGTDEEEAPVSESKIEEFCFELKSQTPGARNKFSAFDRTIRSKLASFDGYRGVQVDGQASGTFGGSVEVVITVRIRAMTTGGSDSVNAKTLLGQHVDDTAKSIGIFGFVAECNSG